MTVTKEQLINIINILDDEEYNIVFEDKYTGSKYNDFDYSTDCMTIEDLYFSTKIMEEINTMISKKG